MMACDWCWWCGVGLVVYVMVQLLRFLLSDCDLSLQWADKFGKPPSRLARKVIWITGASSGIGEHLAYVLAKSGCQLVLTARRKAELDRVKQKCLASGILLEEDIMVLPLDLTKFDHHKPAVDEVLQRFKQIDILVNNAGRGQKASWEKIDISVDREMMELNLFSVLSLTRLVLPSMIERGQGHIAVMSSVLGKHTIPGSSVYCGSKHALQGYFNSLRTEMSSKNIKVTMLCPGAVITEFLQHSMTHCQGKNLDLKTKWTPFHLQPSRCASLCAVALANELKEAWIATLPSLILIYLNQWCPTFSTWLFDKLMVQMVEQVLKLGSYKEQNCDTTEEQSSVHDTAH